MFCIIQNRVVFIGFIYITLISHQNQKKVLQRTKLRRQSLDEIAKKEKIIIPELFEKYFGQCSPSDIYKTLNETANSEKNRARVNEIENRKTGLIEMLKSNPTSNPKEIKNRNNMLEIVKRILFFLIN